MRSATEKELTRVLRTLPALTASARAVAQQAEISIVGSFFALRIEDPKRTVTVADAEEIVHRTGHILVERELVRGFRPLQGFCIISDGIVANWTRL